jgi:TRAP-type C4-dicarboxylate transport system substrate-binding protein
MKHSKKLLASALAVAFSAVGFSASAANVDGPQVEWRYSMWGNPRAYTAGLEHLAKRLNEETGGNFTITIGYGEVRCFSCIRCERQQCYCDAASGGARASA